MPDPITMAAIIGGGFSLAQNIWSAKRQDSAHRREVRDLIGAGINPIHSAGGQGAPSQPLEDVGRSAMSAAQVGKLHAETELLKAQAASERSSQALRSQQIWEIGQMTPARVQQLASSASLANMSKQQMESLLPFVQARAEEELRLTRSNVSLAGLEAELRRARLTGELNLQKWEERLGEAGPASQSLFRLLQAIGRLR